MKKNRILLWVLIGILAIALSAGAFFLLRPKSPDPQELLAQADSLTEQNLCLMAILEEEPDNRLYQEQVLSNYASLGADPLTIYALEQTYGIKAPIIEQPTPEQAGNLLHRGGIAGMKDYKGAYSVAQGADMTYYATDEGIYADYYGLKVKIASVQASNLISAENGLYFLNDMQHKVQYIAKDGHKIETISPLNAMSFAFFGEALWVVGTDYTLYRDEIKVELSHPIRAIEATPDTLYAACNDEQGGIAGVLAFNKEGSSSMVLTSPALSIFGGEDGCLYYINEFSLPMRYSPATKEAIFLSEKEAIAVTYENGTVYTLNEKGKIKVAK